jgi:CRP-like cAMP-binding protein
LKDGRRQILSFLLPGDCLNMSTVFVDRIGYSVKTLTAISLCVFNADDLFDVICASPVVTRRAGAHCAKAHAEAEELILDLGRRMAFDRVRHLIGGLVKRLKARGFIGPVYPLPLTQLHIADATGLTPVHVGRILGEMRQSKLLELQRGRLTLHDPDWLQGSSR